jgi:putative serine protease PepD
MASVRGRRKHAGGSGGSPPRVGIALAGVVGVLAAVAACSSGAGRQAGPANQTQRAYERVVRLVLPSVVQIDAGSSTGSGVVFDSKGDIVTNEHVVAGSKSYEVLVSASAKPLSARLVGSFAPDDLAVIRVKSGANDLRPARWANSDQAQIGELVLAMGSPLGLTDSVTQGIISATGRTVTGPPKPGKIPMVITDALQTSAAINPGNSGGALVLLSGAVLGIPTLTATSSDQGGEIAGIGFAIPSNTVRMIASQLIDSGRVTRSGRASLQITGSTHTNSHGSADGVSVDATQPGGAAAVAGIKAGDVITEFGGSRILTLAELEDALIDYRPGDKVGVKVLRNGAQQEFTVKLGSLSG